jgi:hypothetical protein
MNLRPNFLKSKDRPAPRVNSYSQHQPGKLFSRKKVIKPISPEAEIHAAAAIQRPTSYITKKSQVKKVSYANKDAHLISGVEARTNTHVKLDPLVSRLDAKTRRNRRLVAFTAQVLLWAAMIYILFL